MIVIGADTHRRTHELAAVDDATGRVRGGRRISAELIAAERTRAIAPDGTSRRSEREPGKSDRIDALAVARALAKERPERFAPAYLVNAAMEIRLLSHHRQVSSQGARASRTPALASCCALSSSSPSSRARSTRSASLSASGRAFAVYLPARTAREQVTTTRDLRRPINTLQLELRNLVKAHRPQLLAETRLRPADSRDPDRQDKADARPETLGWFVG